nr:PREDICTED: uncharacterized protein LOC109039549 [Bemisia tabaci]
MAVLANHSLLLFIGLLFSTTCCPTFAHHEKTITSPDGEKIQIKYLHEVIPVEKEPESVGQTMKTSEELNTLKTRGINFEGLNINNGGSDGKTSFLDNVNGLSLSGKMPDRLTLTNNKRIDINDDDLILRGNSNKKLRVNVIGNQVYIDDKLVCEDTQKLDKKATYQKSDDGTFWYTNIKIGQPMSEAEIQKFEQDRAENIVENRFKKQEKSDEPSNWPFGGPSFFSSGGQDWFQDLFKDTKPTSWRAGGSDNEGTPSRGRKPASIIRNSNQVITGNANHGFTDDDPMPPPVNGSRRRPPLSIINRNNVFNGFGNGAIISNGGAVFSSTTHNWIGHHVDANQDGLVLRGSLPGGDLDVSLRNHQVYVNGKLIADDVSKLGEKLSYSKSSDGALWHGNVIVGEEVTDKAEIDAFEKEWTAFQAEVERRNRERQAARERRMKEKQADEELRMKERLERQESRDRLRRQRSARRQRGFRDFYGE